MLDQESRLIIKINLAESQLQPFHQRVEEYLCICFGRQAKFQIPTFFVRADIAPFIVQCNKNYGSNKI